MTDYSAQGDDDDIQLLGSSPSNVGTNVDYTLGDPHNNSHHSSRSSWCQCDTIWLYVREHPKRSLIGVLVSLVLLMVFVTVSLHAMHRDPMDPPSTPSDVCAKPDVACSRRGVVSTTNKLATQVGVEILRQGVCAYC
jgi:hypothetical protein